MLIFEVCYLVSVVFNDETRSKIKTIRKRDYHLIKFAFDFSFNWNPTSSGCGVGGEDSVMFC